MSIASLDLDKAIGTIWSADGDLDSAFKQLWAETDRNKHVVLHDEEAAPGTPFPYCVIDVQKPSVKTRMSGHTKYEKHEIRDVPVEFRIHAKYISSSGKTAKEIAGELADLVLAYFGGHPTIVPKVASLEYGNCLIIQYQSHYGNRTGDDEYQMTINYLFRLDVPVMIGPNT